MAIADRITNDPDAPFTLASLVGDAGSGANGEKLVNTLAHAYPQALQAATLKRLNERLTNALDQDAIDSVAEAAGAPADSDLNVKVRGGDVREKDAVVTYAFHDETGQLWKGCFPWTELGKSDPDGHVSQRESLAGAPEAAEYERAQAKARRAGESSETKSLRAKVEELQAQLESQPAPGDPEPVRDYGKAKATDIATMLSAADRSTTARVWEYERSHEQRKTVVEAAEKRIAALDAADKAAVDEVATLRARVAELEAAQPPTPSA